LTDLKRATAPVFLIYAGIIHAIGLSLLLPMIITLPGQGSMFAPKDISVDVELDPAKPDRDITSAVSAPKVVKEAAIDAGPPPEQPDSAANAPGNIANLLPPEVEQDTKLDAVKAPAPQAKGKEKAKSNNAKPATTVKKPVAQRRPTLRRPAKKDKIMPFGGAMSGLFTPGAPAKRR
jgi:hypothetical protein